MKPLWCRWVWTPIGYLQSNIFSLFRCFDCSNFLCANCVMAHQVIYFAILIIKQHILSTKVHWQYGIMVHLLKSSLKTPNHWNCTTNSIIIIIIVHHQPVWALSTAPSIDFTSMPFSKFISVTVFNHHHYHNNHHLYKIPSLWLTITFSVHALLRGPSCQHSWGNNQQLRGTSRPGEYYHQNIIITIIKSSSSSS